MKLPTISPAVTHGTDINMCGLCGVLGVQDHWSDTLGTQSETNDLRIKRRREKARRIQLANRFLAFYGVKLTDWPGGGYKLSTATGRTVLLPHLAAFCPQVEALCGRPVDPLATPLIEYMQSRAINA